MVENFARAAIAAAIFIAVPGVAQAGTVTATANVTMQVGTQCTISGANVHMGSFKNTDTWGTVGAKHGSYVYVYTGGTAGKQSLYFGSVNCDAGLPWSLTIKGSSTGSQTLGAIRLTLNGKTAVMYPAIKQLGASIVSDSMSAFFPGTGNQVWSTALSGIGTGAPQDMYGNITVSYTAAESNITSSTVLGPVNSGSDSLLYTLTF